jgi:hypothetical protein
MAIFKISMRSISFLSLCPQSWFLCSAFLLLLHSLTGRRSFVTDVGEGKSKELSSKGLRISPLHSFPDLDSLWSERNPALALSDLCNDPRTKEGIRTVRYQSSQNISRKSHRMEK